jgi:FixJ family two-component response regulator
MLPIVHVVDDDASFRTAIGRLLAASGYQVALYGSASELLEKLPGRAPGCILLDVEMSGLNGPQLQNRLGEIGHKLPIVFLTGHGDVPTSVRAIKAGAEDFLTKPVPKKDLLAAIERALVHYEEMRDHDNQIATMQSLVSSLTPREREVFALVVRGKLNKQIAHELGTAERTIKAHRQQVMEKCEVRSLAGLVLIAERLGMLVSPHGGRP